MLAEIKERFQTAKVTVERKISEQIDPSGKSFLETQLREAEAEIALLKHRLTLIKVRSDYFQGRAAVHARELTSVNKAMQRKAYGNKQLRAKIVRLIANDGIDPQREAEIAMHNVDKHKATARG